LQTNHQIVQDSTTNIARSIAATALTASALLLPAASLPALAEEVTKKKKKPKVLETELGIKYIELKKGSGPYPQPGDFVVISYSGFLTNGTMFDSTEIKGRKPLSFRFGKKQQIQGLESVLANMQPGGECTCTIPPKYAYGADGVCVPNEGCIVPPNETVNYVVKLRAVAPAYG
jgi:FKBP-type peptidyl-prolyl cis-trans isomerase